MPKNEKQPLCWSEKVGRKGINRVRVFERTPGGPIYIEFKINDPKTGRLAKRPQSLEELAGGPVLDRDLARDIAIKVSEGLRARRVDDVTQRVRELLGLKRRRTLRELLQRLHEVRGPTWGSAKYAAGQELYRKFWLNQFGGDCDITEITSDRVTVAARTRGVNPAPRTVNGTMRYLKDAFIFAQQELKWITEDHNLSNLKMLKVDPITVPYEEDELLALWPRCLDIDLRLAVVFAIAMDTGRRVNAVRQLRVTDIVIKTVRIRHGGTVTTVELMAIRFPGKKDKAGTTGLAYVTPSTRALVEELLRTPAVEQSGFLIPNRRDVISGKLTRREAKAIGPAPERNLNALLRRAEGLAGVDHIDGRAFHGIKRGSVTIQAEEAGNMELVAKQAGTTPEMLRARYFQTPHSELARMVVNMEDRWKAERVGTGALKVV